MAQNDYISKKLGGNGSLAPPGYACDRINHWANARASRLNIEYPLLFFYVFRLSTTRQTRTAFW